MARAKRHYIPGQVWHLTHRCHKRDFLLKLKMDRRNWVQWLYAAKKRYGLVILNYCVTSNHIHLLVQDAGKRDVIPRSLQLIAGRTGQEYNMRKKRKGAFWEDRYHSTAVETEQHLLRCLVYIDSNMVRAGVVAHPSEWPFCGYNEIQMPKRKSVLIDYQKLAKLTGFASYSTFRETHKELVNESVTNRTCGRQPGWSESVAVGSRSFVETIHSKLGFRGKGRKVLEHDIGFQLREKHRTYNVEYDGRNEDIGSINTSEWDVNFE